MKGREKLLSDIYTTVIHVQILKIGLSAIIRNITANDEIHIC